MGKGCGGVTSDNFSAFLAMNPRLLFDYESDFDHCRSDSTIMFPVTSSGRQDRVPSEVDFFVEISGKPVAKEETTVQDSSRRDGGGVNTGLQLVSANTRGDVVSDDRSRDELVQLQMEMEKLNEENRKLKVMLHQLTNNYSALQMSFQNLMRQSRKNQDDSELQIIGTKLVEKRIENGDPVVLQRRILDLVSKDQSNSSSDERTLSKSPNMDMDSSGKKRSGRDESPESEGWPLDKTPKLNPPSEGAKASDSSVEATMMRKARVSVRARTEAPMISDGCQWRKYGQKMAKGNPCPRAYYRCSMAVGCPVRKQVQRCAEDQTILITTYEGTHNHPLPPAATAMASTTTAAASMLLSGAMPSSDGLMNPNILARTILPCSSNMATISASAPFPTITLDLTNSTPPRPPQHFPVPMAPGSNVFAPAVYNQSTFSGLQVSQGMVHQQGQPSLVEALSATTAAITADPNFITALAAAVSSIIGGGGGVMTNNNSNSSNTANIDTSTSNNNNNKSDSSFTGS